MLHVLQQTVVLLWQYHLLFPGQLVAFLLKSLHQLSKHPQGFTHDVICRFLWSCQLPHSAQLQSWHSAQPWGPCHLLETSIVFLGYCDMQRVPRPVSGGAAACDLHVR